jgi:hypothetical protein
MATRADSVRVSSGGLLELGDETTDLRTSVVSHRPAVTVSTSARHDGTIRKIFAGSPLHGVA